MNHQKSKRAGEVIVNSLEVMTEFERKCIQILRHANDLFEKKDPRSPKKLKLSTTIYYIS